MYDVAVVRRCRIVPRQGSRFGTVEVGVDWAGDREMAGGSPNPPSGVMRTP